MKKKIILIITLIITLFFINSNDIYADAFCDKLEEKQGYTNLCQYIYIDGTLPITANLYIKNGETMIEWKCDTRNSNVIKEAKGICDRNTTQIINSTEGEKIIEGGKNGLFSRVYFHFYNYIHRLFLNSYYLDMLYLLMHIHSHLDILELFFHPMCCFLVHYHFV